MGAILSSRNFVITHACRNLTEQGTKSVDYNGLVAPLIESVKQLKEKNGMLEAQTAVLKTQAADLKAQADFF